MKRFDEYADAGLFKSISPDALHVLREMCWEAHSRNFGDPFIFERGDEALARRCGKGTGAIRKSREKLIKAGLLRREGRPASPGRVQRLRILLPPLNGATTGAPISDERSPSRTETMQPQSLDGAPTALQWSNHITGQQGNKLNKEDKAQHRANFDRLALTVGLSDLTYGTNIESSLHRLTAQGITIEDLERWARLQHWRQPAQFVKCLEEYAGEIEAKNSPPKRPEWCHECDERTRMITLEREDGRPIAQHCPNCSIANRSPGDSLLRRTGRSEGQGVPL